MPLIQNTPMLTVYRSGIINLNGEATRLMHDAHMQGHNGGAARRWLFFG